MYHDDYNQFESYVDDKTMFAESHVGTTYCKIEG